MTTLTRWLEAKRKEKEATAERLEIEKEILAHLDKPDDFEGVEKLIGAGLVAKVTYKLNRKCDYNGVMSVVMENGLENLDLFRYKAELNKKIWDKTNPGVTSLFDDVIEIKPAKPSITVAEIEKEA